MSHLEEEKCDLLLKNVPKKKTQKTMSLVDFVEDPKREESLIGLQYVVDVKMLESDKSVVKCNLCGVKGEMATMKEHLVGVNHIKVYMEKHYFSVLQSLKKSAPHKNHLAKLLKSYAKEIERAEGTQSITMEYVSAADMKKEQEYWMAGKSEKSEFHADQKKSHVLDKRQIALNYSEKFKISSREEATIVLNLTQQLSDQLEQYFLKYKGLNVLESTMPSRMSTKSMPAPANLSTNVHENLHPTSAANQGLKSFWRTEEPSSSSVYPPANVHSFDRVPAKLEDTQGLKRKLVASEDDCGVLAESRGDSEFQSRKKRQDKQLDHFPTMHSSSSLSYMNDLKSPQRSSAEVSSSHSSSIAATYTHISTSKVKPCVPETYGGGLHMVKDTQNSFPQNSFNDNISQIEAVQEMDQLNDTDKAKTSDLRTEKNTAFPEPSASTSSNSYKPSPEKPSSSHTQGKTSKTLSPDILQLLKGKDANTVTNILRTLSPFYPALQDVNLEILAQVNIGAMSGDREDSSKKRSYYYCKVCQVACLNDDGLRSHYRDEQHEKMEDAYYGKRYGKHFYGSLQDYISCPMRKEPLIGLQYIVQLYPEIDCEDAFKCNLCKVIGPLYFIMKHIESFKHRRNYLSISYKHLFPLYKKHHSFYEKNSSVKKHALKVEQQERTLTVNDSKSCSSRIGVKSDFLKYNIRRQEKLAEYAEKRSAYETQKKNILQYMETLVITTPEEAELVQNLTQELEAAVNVFNINTKPRYICDGRRECEQSTEDTEGKYSRHTDFHYNKRRSIWYEKDRKPSSSSLCGDEVQSVSDKHSLTEKGRTRKRSRSSSKDMMLKVTFSTGSEKGVKNENAQQEQPSICPDKEQFVVLSDHFRESREAIFHNPDANSDLFQEIQAKRIRKHSTDVAKWNSLFTSSRPEVSHSVFSCRPKSPLLNNTEVPPSEEKKGNPRRASLEALSSFTLFSQEAHEPGPSSSQPSSDTFKLFSSFQGSVFQSHKSNVFKDKAIKRETKIEWDIHQEFPCSSNTFFTEARSGDNVMMNIKQEPYDECTLNTEASCDQLSDVNANAAQAPKSSHVLDTSSKNSDLKACGSMHSDTKTDNQEPDSSTVSNNTSSKLHASRRQLSPEVLQLFKGKDTNSIVHILKTLSPFYPALQELDLEEFAEVLSKTGAVSE
ncbi:uncharacterized protein LOC130273673 isoform X2 [Hyla sarda]|nr:uncharacterized protein LOC130273673 isoform X2 [Hyla sarda]